MPAPRQHPLDSLLADAFLLASTEWEETFVTAMGKARERNGLAWDPTEAQVAKLHQIADDGE